MKGKVYPHIKSTLIKETKKPLGLNILEIGAGGCQYKEIFKNHKYTSTDIKESPNYINDIDVFCDAHDLSNYFKTQKFDLVFIVASLYLMNSPIRVCKEVNKILKKDGVFLVFDYPPHIQKDLMKRHFKNNIYINIPCWSYDQLRIILSGTGFCLIKNKSVISQRVRFHLNYDRFNSWLIIKSKKK